MNRTICPQVAGIYENNEASKEGVFVYLLIPHNQPDAEFKSEYAHSCSKDGTLDPARQFRTIYEATAFGKFVKAI